MRSTPEDNRRNAMAFYEMMFNSWSNNWSSSITHTDKPLLLESRLVYQGI
jgi:hypothetical protein